MRARFCDDPFGLAAVQGGLDRVENDFAKLDDPPIGNAELLIAFAEQPLLPASE